MSKPQGQHEGQRPPARVSLTPAERDLLVLVLRGQTPEEMAASLAMSVHDVQAALERVQERFGASSRRGLIVRALLQGWHAIL